MLATARRKKILGMLFVGVTVFAIAPGQARAQFGIGFGGGGFGLGYGFGFSQVPLPDSFLYSKAISDSRRDTHIPSRDAYANNSNSYINHVRDNGFVDRYPVARRDPDYYRYGAPTHPTHGLTSTAMTATAASPSLPLTSFYTPQGVIVWPADAPTAGDLNDRRAAFDQASHVVFKELKGNGVASIAAVTDARQKLLNYGRPGLKYAREHETPRVADTYHLFLLSLYESLAQAVNPPTTATAAPAPPPAS